MALLGTTIKESIAAFKKPSHAPGGVFGASASTSQGKLPSQKEVWARMLISILLIGVAVWLLNKDSKSQAALTIIGFVSGYWLK